MDLLIPVPYGIGEGTCFHLLSPLWWGVWKMTLGCLPWARECLDCIYCS